MPEYDITFSPTVHEMVFVGEDLVHSGPRPRLPDTQFQPHFSYAFYSRKTGEVWARRICLDGDQHWVYVPAEPPFLFLTYEAEAGIFAGALALFAINWELKREPTADCPNHLLSHLVPPFDPGEQSIAHGPERDG